MSSRSRPVRRRKPAPGWHKAFLAMLPTIANHARLAFRYLDPDARQEAVHAVVCNAMVAYVRLWELGKASIAYPTVLARYGVAQVRDGRVTGGHLNGKDISSSYCQRKTGIFVGRIDHHDRLGDAWLEVLLEDKHAGPPFDSPQHLFEIKWDGVRAVAAVEGGRWQLWGRDLADYQLRYPELEVLGRLPGGTVLDGELVVLQNGRPTLENILRRHQLVSPRKIQYASRQLPVTYVLFDLLYWQGRALLEQPLSQRRARLEELLQGLVEPRLAFSAGAVGPGREFFDQAVAQGHEGVMAKYLNGPYVPGRRMSSWRKIKPRLVLPCVIIGYTAAHNGVQSLVVAAEREGILQYAATLTLGLSPEVRARLGPLLVRRIRQTPVIPCRHRATWVEPELYCQVRCLERTARGRLRSASFQGLLGESPCVSVPDPTSTLG